MKRVLFLCSRNRRRSPTAERVFAAWPGIEAAQCTDASRRFHLLDASVHHVVLWTD